MCAEFTWEDVKVDKHRENYLGHSIKAPVGRWQKGTTFLNSSFPAILQFFYCNLVFPFWGVYIFKVLLLCQNHNFFFSVLARLLKFVLKFLNFEFANCLVRI